MRVKLVREKKGPKLRDIRVFFPGTVVDRAMRAWLTDDDRKPGGMVECVEAVLDREEKTALETSDGIVRWRHADDRAQIIETCGRLLTNLEPLLDKLVLPFEFEPAHNFRVNVGLPAPDGSNAVVTLVGEMDLLVRYQPEQWGIYDLKFTANKDYWRKTIQQLTFYSIARRAMFGGETVIAALLQPLIDPPYVAAKADVDSEAQLFARLIRYAHSLWLGDFPYVESTNECYSCSVQDACPRFRPVPGTHRLSWGPPGPYQES